MLLTLILALAAQPSQPVFDDLAVLATRDALISTGAEEHRCPSTLTDDPKPKEGPKVRGDGDGGRKHGKHPGRKHKGKHKRSKHNPEKKRGGPPKVG